MLIIAVILKCKWPRPRRLGFRSVDVVIFVAPRQLVGDVVLVRNWLQWWPKLLGRSTLPPSPRIHCWDIELSVRWGDPTLCGGGGDIISSSNVITSAWEWSTEFVVRVLFVTVDFEAAFQLILTRIVAAVYCIHCNIEQVFGWETNPASTLCWWLGVLSNVSRPVTGLKQFQEECLLTHNEYRLRHGAAPLQWSQALAWQAQCWAEHLARVGDLRHNDDDTVGENLAGMLGDDLTGREATDIWYDEIADYDFDQPGYGEETSNFSQVRYGLLVCCSGRRIQPSTVRREAKSLPPDGRRL